MASIACVILWGNGRVSHYLAGDSYFDQEDPLIDFLNRGETERIGAVKLSHHGAHSSSPSKLFLELQPQSVVVSAGTMHGHPRELSSLHEVMKLTHDLVGRMGINALARLISKIRPYN